MTKSIQDTPKKRGRPKTTGRGTGIMLRLQPDALKQLDKWIAENDPDASRPEAVRRILNKELGEFP